ncbi:hypothetical protein [uncultured Croceitalea sp.]|uniref:hypothetical protein n=1 Tax=uncultured Croceitalea sp. TaxID=1798908 RepID=UPI0033061398
MNLDNSFNHRIERIGAIAGILSIVLYFSAAVLPFIPDVLARLFGFVFPLLWIVSFMGLYNFLKKENRTPSLEIGYLFGIIGAALALIFIVVQQANYIWYTEAKETLDTENALELAKAAFRGANRVQLAMDVAFDIFITIAWFLFGLNISRSKSFGRILGWITCILSFSLLMLNMITFPDPPARVGLFDLGPFLGFWTMIIYIKFILIVHKAP